MTDKQDDFFIGYAQPPKADRRFFLGAGLALLAGTAATAGGLAVLQSSPGAGSWDQAAVKDYTGIVTADPYPLFRTLDVTGKPKTVLLSCLGKCGVDARLSAMAGKAVTIRGSLIHRGPHAMIAVVDGMDWIREADTQVEEALRFPEASPGPMVTLTGEILDTKCWFGAMRPSSGKVHKSCAALCIRGGIPPGIFGRDEAGRAFMMVMTDGGAAHGEALLPFVGEPVVISGQTRTRGDVTFLDAGVAAIRFLG